MTQSWNKLMDFFKARGNAIRPKVEVLLETERYIVKTATTFDELSQSFALRHDIFYKELIQKTLPLGLDIDSFDCDCDHLIIVERKSQQVVGTYRLRSSLHTDKFYTETEFEIRGLLDELKEPKVEIGRACVHAAHRRGAVFHLLWRGIGEYVRKTGSRYLFGCSSVPTTDGHKVQLLSAYLRSKGLLIDHPRVQPFHGLPETIDGKLSPEEIESGKNYLNPLIQFYLMNGAKLIGRPALDTDLLCIDYFTLIDILDVDQRCLQKYQMIDSKQSKSEIALHAI